MTLEAGHRVEILVDIAGGVHRTGCFNGLLSRRNSHRLGCGVIREVVLQIRAGAETREKRYSQVARSEGPFERQHYRSGGPSDAHQKAAGFERVAELIIRL